MLAHQRRNPNIVLGNWRFRLSQLLSHITIDSRRCRIHIEHHYGRFYRIQLPLADGTITSSFNPKSILSEDNHGQIDRPILREHSEQFGVCIAPIRNRIRIQNHRQFSGSTRPYSFAIR